MKNRGKLKTALVMALAVISLVLFSCENEPEPVPKGMISIELDDAFGETVTSYHLTLDNGKTEVKMDAAPSKVLVFRDVMSGTWEWTLSADASGERITVSSGIAEVQNGRTADIKVAGSPVRIAVSGIPEGSSAEYRIGDKLQQSPVFWLEEGKHSVLVRTLREGSTDSISSLVFTVEKGKAPVVPHEIKEEFKGISSVVVKATGADEIDIEFIGEGEPLLWKEGDRYDLKAGKYKIKVTFKSGEEMLGTITEERNLVAGENAEPVLLEGKTVSLSVSGAPEMKEGWSQKLTLRGKDLVDISSSKDTSVRTWLPLGKASFVYTATENSIERGKATVEFTVGEDTPASMEVPYEAYPITGWLTPLIVNKNAREAGVSEELVLYRGDEAFTDLEAIPVGDYTAVYTVKREGKSIGSISREMTIVEGRNEIEIYGVVHRICVMDPPVLEEGWTEKIVADTGITVDGREGYFWFEYGNHTVIYSAYYGNKEMGSSDKGSMEMKDGKLDFNVYYRPTVFKGQVKIGLAAEEGFGTIIHILKDGKRVETTPVDGVYELPVGRYDVECRVTDKVTEKIIGMDKSALTVVEGANEPLLFRGDRVTITVTDTPDYGTDRVSDSIYIAELDQRWSGKTVEMWLPYGRYTVTYDAEYGAENFKVAGFTKEITVSCENGSTYEIPYDGKALVTWSVKGNSLYKTRLEYSKDGTAVPSTTIYGKSFVDPGVYDVTLVLYEGETIMGRITKEAVDIKARARNILEYECRPLVIEPKANGFTEADYVIVLNGIERTFSDRLSFIGEPGSAYSWTMTAHKKGDPEKTVIGTAEGTGILPDDGSYDGVWIYPEVAKDWGYVEVSVSGSAEDLSPTFMKEGRRMTPVVMEGGWKLPAGTYDVYIAVMSGDDEIGSFSFPATTVETGQTKTLSIEGNLVRIRIKDAPSGEGYVPNLSVSGQMAVNASEAVFFLPDGDYQLDYTMMKDGILDGKVWESFTVPSATNTFEFSYKAPRTRLVSVICTGADSYDIVFRNSEGIVIEPSMQDGKYVLPYGTYGIEAVGCRGAGEGRVSMGSVVKEGVKVGKDTSEIKIDGTVITFSVTDVPLEELPRYRERIEIQTPGRTWEIMDTRSAEIWVEKGVETRLTYGIYSKDTWNRYIYQKYEVFNPGAPKTINWKFTWEQADFKLECAAPGKDVTAVFRNAKDEVFIVGPVTADAEGKVQCSLPKDSYELSLKVRDGARLMGSAETSIWPFLWSHSIGAMIYSVEVTGVPEELTGMTETITVTGADPVKGRSGTFWSLGGDPAEIRYEATMDDALVGSATATYDGTCWKPDRTVLEWKSAAK